MAKEPLRVLLDTNVWVSALVYGGKPREILLMIVMKRLTAITSSQLLAELSEMLTKKFAFSSIKIQLMEKKLKNNLEMVRPAQTLTVLRDVADNIVLEAALTGNCAYIITGDKELLELKEFRGIKIVTPHQFLKL